MTTTGDTVALHVRDHGGTGPPLLLLHGAGADSSLFDVVGPLLASTFHPLAVDLRGHGRSDAGPVTWNAVLDDLEVVCDERDLHRPAVVGHSVGGLVAGRWAARHPECPGAVSLDGHRHAGVDVRRHDAAAAGLDESELRRDADGFTTWFEDLFAGLEATKTPEQAVASATARGLLYTDDLASFTDVGVPLLLLVAAASGPMMPARWEPLMTAFRGGLRRDLRELADRNRHVTVEELDASHGMVTERPDDIARRVAAFLAPA